MSMFSRRPRDRRERDRPDVEGARADLARIKGQRSDVESLVADLMREKQLNNFTANITVTFRGRRA